MSGLTRYVIAHRRLVILAWVALAMFGGFAAGKVNARFSTDFSTPGQSAYDAGKRAYEDLGNGRQQPVQLVYRGTDDVRDDAAIQRSIAAVVAAAKGARSVSYFDTREPVFVSRDGRTTFASVYTTGIPGFALDEDIPRMEKALRASTPPGVEAHLTGYIPIVMSQSEEQGSGILKEVGIGAAGALVVLLLIFGTLPAVLMPLMIAIVSIMTTYAAVWGLSYMTDVSLIVQFLIGLVGLGIGIDYALLVIFRYREELGVGKDAHTALVDTMQHAGHSVIVSGSTVGIGLISMVLVPVPFIRSIGLGGMLIPLVSVLATITLLPAVLSLLGTRINRLRIPLLWRLANLDDHHGGRFWPGWARFVSRRPWPVFLVGLVVVGLLFAPVLDMHIGDTQVKNEPAAGDAGTGKQMISGSGLPQGVYGPIQLVVEGGPSQADIDRIVEAVRGVDGIDGVSAPTTWEAKGTRVVEVVQHDDPYAEGTTRVLDRLNDDALPAVRDELGDGVRVTVAGPAAESRGFVDAVYGRGLLLVGFVVLLTFLLLARALRSIVLPLKAVILNLVSLGAAYGVITFVFQQGHMSDAIWGYQATGSIISWIPLMIFAFLFGISMDYEVFMLTRIREAYDGGSSTGEAVELGLARTGKLVTSGAAILMFTFLVMSTQPGPDFKQFAIGLAAGIVIDATVIRVLLVPATVKLLGRANWWFPEWARKALLLPVDPTSRHGGPPSVPPAAPMVGSGRGDNGAVLTGMASRD